MKSLILMGYMGCGKSALGIQIARQTSLPFIDLDQYIESEEKKTISSIFNEQGEIYFRKKERLYMQQLLLTKSNHVISLGGGTPCYFDNIDFLNRQEESFTVFLKTSPKELTQRLYAQKDLRPVIAHLESEEKLEEYIAKHLFERMPFYQKANKTITTDHKTIDSLVDEILGLLT